MSNSRLPADHDEDSLGLSNDLTRLLALANRRRVLKLMAGAAVLPLLRCGSDGGTGTGDIDDTDSSSDDSSGSSDTGTSSGECAEIPEETAGPYPSDGSNDNGNNALALSGIVRQDIRSSIAGVSGTAAGIPLNVNLTIVDVNNSCLPLVGYAVYLWHCTQDGQYSLYTLKTQNYLRGVQESDNDGRVTFTTIFPGCYSGRMPHIHFEVYPTLEMASSYRNKLATSQLAFPGAPCNAVYATSGYEASVSNFAKISFATDNVFSDGVTRQLSTVTGSVDAGYEASLTVAIAG